MAIQQHSTVTPYFIDELTYLHPVNAFMKPLNVTGQLLATEKLTLVMARTNTQSYQATCCSLWGVNLFGNCAIEEQHWELDITL